MLSRSRVLSAVLVAMVAAACSTSPPQASIGTQTTSPASPVESAGLASPSAPGETTWERIQRDGVITFGFGNEPPFTIAELENVSGSDVDTFKAVFDQYQEFKYQGVLIDFAGEIPALLARRLDADVAGTIISKERCETVGFGNPLLRTIVGLVVKAGNPKDLHSLKDIADDASAKVATQPGTVYQDYLQIAGVKPEQIIELPTPTNLVDAVKAGRADAALNLRPLLQNVLNVARDEGLAFADPFDQPLGEDGKPSESYTATVFRKEDTDLIDAYNQGLAKIRDSGKLQEIFEKYQFPDESMPDPALTAEVVCSTIAK